MSFIRSRRGRGIRSIISFIDTLSLFLGLAAPFSWIYLNVNPGSWCAELHHRPLINLGFFLLGLFLFKYLLYLCFPATKKPSTFTFFYSICLSLLIILIFSFTIFALSIKADGVEVPGKAYKEYNKPFWGKPYVNPDFSSWFLRYVRMRKMDWYKIRQCLVNSPVCENFTGKYKSQTESEFDKNKLTPLESGCCKPLSVCRYTYKNATWDRPTIPKCIETNETHCGSHHFYYEERRICVDWENKESGWLIKKSGWPLCYRCDSCMAAFLVNMKKEWTHTAITNICILFLTVIFYFIRRCNNRNIDHNLSLAPKFYH